MMEAASVVTSSKAQAHNANDGGYEAASDTRAAEKRSGEVENRISSLESITGSHYTSDGR